MAQAPGQRFEDDARRILGEIKETLKRITLLLQSVEESVQKTGIGRPVARGVIDTVRIDFSVRTSIVDDGIERLETISKNYGDLYRKVRAAELKKIRHRDSRTPGGVQGVGFMYVLGHADINGDGKRYLTLDINQIEFDINKPGQILLANEDSYYIDEDPDTFDLSSVRFASNSHQQIAMLDNTSSHVVIFQLPYLLPVQLDPDKREPISVVRIDVEDEREAGGNGTVYFAPPMGRHTSYTLRDTTGNILRTVVQGSTTGTMKDFLTVPTGGSPPCNLVGDVVRDAQVTITPGSVLEVTPLAPGPLTLMYFYLDIVGSAEYDTYYYRGAAGVDFASTVHWEVLLPCVDEQQYFTLTPIGLDDFNYALQLRGPAPGDDIDYSYNMSDAVSPCLPVVGNQNPATCTRGKINTVAAAALKNGLGVATQLEGGEYVFRSGYIFRPPDSLITDVAIPLWEMAHMFIYLKTPAEDPSCPGGAIGGGAGDASWLYHFAPMTLSGVSVKDDVSAFSASRAIPSPAVSDVVSTLGSSHTTIAFENKPDSAPGDFFPRLRMTGRNFLGRDLRSASPSGGPYSAGIRIEPGDDCGCIGTVSCDIQKSWSIAFPVVASAAFDTWSETDISRGVSGDPLLVNHRFDQGAKASMNAAGDLRLVIRQTCTGPGNNQLCPSDLSPRLLRDNGVTTSVATMVDENGDPVDDAFVTPRPCRFFLNTLRGLFSFQDSGLENRNLGWVVNPEAIDIGDEIKINLTEFTTLAMSDLNTPVFIDWVDA